MKILLATSAAIPTGGGIASYNEEFVRLFHDSHEIYLMTAADEKDVTGYVETWSTYGCDLKSFEFANSILKLIDDWKIDVVFNSDSSLMAILAPFIKVPIVTVSHFVDGKCALNAGFNSAFVSRIVSLSWRAIAEKYIKIMQSQ